MRGGHLGHVTRNICANFCSPILRSLNMKFELNWPSGFREDVWKYWHTTDRQTDRQTCRQTMYAGGIVILIAHLWAFSSGELKTHAHLQSMTIASAKIGKACRRSGTNMVSTIYIHLSENYINHMHIFRPWQKHPQFQKDLDLNYSIILFPLQIWPGS